MQENLTLWEEESAACQLLSVTVFAARPWCDPSQYADVVGADFGKGEMHLYWCSTGRQRRVLADAAYSTLLGLAKDTLLVMEHAHGGVPRTQRSLAQPFTQGQLLSLYQQLAERRITLKLFPHAHSGSRAREWAAFHFPKLVDGKKADATDAMSLALYVKYCNDVSLANPPSSFALCERRRYGNAVIRRANIVLNAERTHEYAGTFFPQIISLGRAIKKASRLRTKAAVSVAALIADEIDGQPVMYVRDGRVPGVWFWSRYVAKMTPFHHKGGIARSNLMRHSFRTFMVNYGRRSHRPPATLGKGSKVIKFGWHDERQRVARTAAMRSFRAALLDAYRAGVAIATSRGFQPFDPMNESKEGDRGR